MLNLRLLALTVFCLVLTLTCSDFAFSQQDGGKPGPGSGTYSAARQRQARNSGKDNTSGASQSNTARSQTGTVPANTVRQENLKNLEELLNTIANGCEILGLIVGGPLCLLVPAGLFFVFRKKQRFIGALMIFTGPAICVLALATPGIINWIVGCMRDANLFVPIVPPPAVNLWIRFTCSPHRARESQSPSPDHNQFELSRDRFNHSAKAQIGNAVELEAEPGI